jgi:threonyl-tRNA synthetase
MDLFHFREESPGSVFGMKKVGYLFQRLVEYMRAKQRLAVTKKLTL